MTDEQKKETLLLRRKGKSYTEIAQATDATINAIRIYCSRNGLTDADLKDARFCEQCGQPMPETDRKKRFCSNNCRMSWWNSHPELVKRKAYYTLTCQCCGKLFKSYGNQKRKYCSRSCYLTKRYGKGAAKNE